MTYVYKAPRWIAKPHGDIFVHKAGDTMTGPLVVAESLDVGIEDFGLRYSDPQRFILFDTQYYFAFDPGTRNMRYTYGSGAVHTTWRDDGAFVVQLTALKPGGGAWGDSSDERIKTVLGDYESGLAAVMALNPVRFVYKGNDTYAEPIGTVPYDNSNHVQVAQAQQEFVGLIAQEAEQHMPEMVQQASGFIDGAPVTDLRMLDTGPLIFALVKSVQELSDRIDQLHTRIKALEAEP